MGAIDDLWAEMQREETNTMRKDAARIAACPNAMLLQAERTQPPPAQTETSWELDQGTMPLPCRRPVAHIDEKGAHSPPEEVAEKLQQVYFETEWAVAHALQRESGHINAEDAASRRRALERLNAGLDRLATPTVVVNVFDAVWRHLLKRFSDSVERCRDLAVRVEHFGLLMRACSLPYACMVSGANHATVYGDAR